MILAYWNFLLGFFVKTKPLSQLLRRYVDMNCCQGFTYEENDSTKQSAESCNMGQHWGQAEDWGVGQTWGHSSSSGAGGVRQHWGVTLLINTGLQFLKPWVTQMSSFSTFSDDPFLCICLLSFSKITISRHCLSLCVPKACMPSHLPEEDENVWICCKVWWETLQTWVGNPALQESEVAG